MFFSSGRLFVLIRNELKRASKRTVELGRAEASQWLTDGISSFLTCSTACFNLIVARFLASSTVTRTWRSSFKCSHLALPRICSSWHIANIANNIGLQYSETLADSSRTVGSSTEKYRPNRLTETHDRSPPICGLIMELERNTRLLWLRPILSSFYLLTIFIFFSQEFPTLIWQRLFRYGPIIFPDSSDQSADRCYDIPNRKFRDKVI